MAAGAAGLVYVRMGEGGAIDAAKPVKEGLSPGQVDALLAATSAQPVSRLPPSMFQAPRTDRKSKCCLAAPGRSNHGTVACRAHAWMGKQNLDLSMPFKHAS